MAGRVDELAHGLLSLGVRKGDAFAILAQTTLEWTLFDFALGLVGAIGAPVYANSSDKDAQYVVAHSEAVGALCQDEEQRRKIEPLGLAHVLTFADFADLRERGRAHALEHPNAVAEATWPKQPPRSKKTTSSRTSTRPVRRVRRRHA